MSQDHKKQIAAKIKPLLKEYGVKATLSVDNHSTINLNIRQSNIDFIGNYNEMEKNKKYQERSGYTQVSYYWLDRNYSGKALEFLQKAFAILMEGNFDKSDHQTDYFHVGWYANINIGKWDKPYVLS